MSFNASLVMVKGDHLDQIERILAAFGPAPIGSRRELESWDEALASLQPRSWPRGIERRMAVVHGGWTVVLDPLAVMWTDAAACQRVHQALGTPVFAMACSGVVGLRAFRYFDGPLARQLWVDAEAGTLEDKGKPLPEEQGIRWATRGSDGVLAVMTRLGLDYPALATAGPFLVLDLLEPDDKAPQPPPLAAAKQPRWKLWR